MPLVIEGVEEVECMGSPISVAVALLLRRPFPVVAVAARLNICGIRARLIELTVLPSEGCNCWNDSNSPSRAFRLRRNSWTVVALFEADFGWTSRTAGTDSPSMR